MNRYLKIGMYSLLLLALSSACSNKKGETTKLGKFYHNVTGRYNAYYNADRLLEKAFEAQTQAHRDNYNQLLPMFPYAVGEAPAAAAAAPANNAPNPDKGLPKGGNPSSSSGGSGNSGGGGPLDEAIKKCAVNIELHRPSNWADDSYFIVGRAEYLKKQYEKSASTFKYIVDKYHTDKALSEMSPDELKEYKKREAEKKKNKKKKKKPSSKKKKPSSSKGKPSSTKGKPEPSTDGDDTDEPKPKKYFLKHRPVRFDAMLWLAKSYIETGNHDDAGRYLRQLIERSDVQRRIKADANALVAYSYIKQKEYIKAIEPLENAVSLMRSKKKKTRYVYILAQLHQKAGNNQAAMENFRKVLRLRPNYEMEFNARLNMAINAVNSDSKINPEMALRRMLRDGKNEEYKDQIYFALAKIQLQGGNKESGIVALQMAMANSDDYQRTEAAYMLAELFYERKDYVKAYAYYDTSSLSMGATDDRSTYVVNQKALLKDLAENINVVVLKDSLVNIAQQPFDKQKELVQRLRQAEEDAKKPQSALERNSAASKQSAETSINTTAVSESKFPLYDPNVVKKGEKDFQKRWGNRDWADNWRRSNLSEEKNKNDVAENEGLKPMTEQEVKEYLKKMGVPLDSAALKQMNKDIEKSLFLVGSLYYEKLDENNRAMEAFKKMFDRYPNTSHELEAWYTMYNICVEDKKTSEANSYKEKILSKYGDSDIAKSLQDPSFMNTKQKQIFEVNKYYEETYALIKQGDIEAAQERLNGLEKKFGKSYPLKPRFAILGAMCKGGTEGVDEYIKALKAVSTSYPNTPEDKKAKEMVALLSGSKTDNKTPNPQPAKNENVEVVDPSAFPFDTDMNTGHYILIAFSNEKTNLNEYKGKIADFNTKAFSLLKLNVSSLMLDGNVPTLIIRKFKDGKEAKEYYNTVLGNAEFLGKDAPAHKIYYIGQNNYRDVLQKRNFAEYGKFFDQVYNKK